GYTDIAEYLLSQGANVHANKDQALLLAVKNGHLDTVKVLVKYGANIDLIKDELIEKSKNPLLSDYLHDLMSGRVCGHYKELSVLGQGSFGTVYKVYNLNDEKEYALKK